jgi:hypothetical protein
VQAAGHRKTKPGFTSPDLQIDPATPERELPLRDGRCHLAP